jgi:hypothetical protein
MIAAAEPPTMQATEPHTPAFQVAAALQDRARWSSRADYPLALEFAFALCTGVHAKRGSQGPASDVLFATALPVEVNTFRRTDSNCGLGDLRNRCSTD